MKTICSIMLAFALMCGQAFSQVETERKAGFQFGLFPPLRTNRSPTMCRNRSEIFYSAIS